MSTPPPKPAKPQKPPKPQKPLASKIDESIAVAPATSTSTPAPPPPPPHVKVTSDNSSTIGNESLSSDDKSVPFELVRESSDLQSSTFGKSAIPIRRLSQML